MNCLIALGVGYLLGNSVRGSEENTKESEWMPRFEDRSPADKQHFIKRCVDIVNGEYFRKQSYVVGAAGMLPLLVMMGAKSLYICDSCPFSYKSGNSMFILGLYVFISTFLLIPYWACYSTWYSISVRRLLKQKVIDNLDELAVVPTMLMDTRVGCIFLFVCNLFSFFYSVYSTLRSQLMEFTWQAFIAQPWWMIAPQIFVVLVAVISMNVSVKLYKTVQDPKIIMPVRDSNMFARASRKRRYW